MQLECLITRTLKNVYLSLIELYKTFDYRAKIFKKQAYSLTSKIAY